MEQAVQQLGRDVFYNFLSIILIIANNQQEVINATAKQGAVFCLGKTQEVTKEIVKSSLSHFLESPEKLRKISKCCSEIVNPLQVKSYPVCRQVMGLLWKA